MSRALIIYISIMNRKMDMTNLVPKFDMNMHEIHVGCQPATHILGIPRRQIHSVRLRAAHMQRSAPLGSIPFAAAPIRGIPE